MLCSVSRKIPGVVSGQTAARKGGLSLALTGHCRGSGVLGLRGGLGGLKVDLGVGLRTPLRLAVGPGE